MASYRSIAKNFRLMVAQVTKQLEKTLELLDAPDPRRIQGLQDGDDYVDYQKIMIENDCFSFIGERAHPDHVVDAVRALNVISGNLERIADLSVNIARQMHYLPDVALLKQFDYRAYFDALLGGLRRIEDALFERDFSQALQICQVEDRVDRLYRSDLVQVVAALRTSSDAGQLVTVLFILHYLERIGDALLNIGEAIVFAVLGERLKFRQYRVLEEAIASTSVAEPSLESAEMASIWGTRSGARIGTVQNHAGSGRGDKVLFKEGNPEKLRREQESLQRWSELAPGLVPAVVEYQREEQGAVLLLQYIDGSTFQEIVLNAEPAVINRAQDHIEDILHRVWTQTRTPNPVGAGFVSQLRARLADVHRVHPDLGARPVRIAGLAVPRAESLVDAAAEIDAALQAPFSVFGHGDLNLDNIIYNAEADTLHFIDVHRSGDMDYVQDASVFLVSSFRMPVFVTRIRAKLEQVSLRFLRFVRAFAAEQGDATFEARLALGLARSFMTSTRFELNRDFAESMHRRAVFLLRNLVAHRGQPWTRFQTPAGVLLY